VKSVRVLEKPIKASSHYKESGMHKELEMKRLTPAEEQNDAVPLVVRSRVPRKRTPNARGRRITIFHRDAAVDRVRLARDADVWIDLEPCELLGHKWSEEVLVGGWRKVEWELGFLLTYDTA